MNGRENRELVMVQEYLGYCLAIPALLALVGMLIAGRLPVRWQPVGAATAILCACLLGGFFLLGKNLHQPERHWHWLPAIAVWCWLAGVAGFRAGSHWLERLFWALTCGALAGYLLVPTWSDLAEQRVYLMVGLGLATVALIMAVDWLGRASRPHFILSCFGVAALVGAAWIGAGFSLTNARWLLITAAALFGVVLSAMLPVARAKLEPGRILPLLSSWLLGGLFIGAIEPNPPRYEILLLATLPVALLAAALGLGAAFRRPDNDVPLAKM
ncbi:MAG: hypothetical protein ACK493_06465 [Planctomycetota bacterium]|nr:hypothetical protein [Blastopirellula sp.]